ncbi:MAG: hypothetical protein HYV47_03600 [Candidatus Nealsonbacteria bacterium]|nr:hypothetical protein [Candidatus Nealsonbacteria bacterium]
MKKYYFLLIFIFVLFSGVLVFATSKEDITYPVASLGNCKNEADCLAYCDKPENMEPCLNFAEKHNLITDKEIAIARKMLAAGKTSGPGGCKGQVECGNYCDDMSHIKECVAFAEENDLMMPEELAEAKKVAAALERGVQPPPCSSKTECDSVCTLPENMRTCIIFAKEAGLMPPEELEEVEKVLAALDKGITPPPCGGRDKCDEYCSLPENFETCITFAEAAGFMSAEEAAMVRRTGGKGPGDCRGKEACEAFCEDPANMEPCINFAIENGFMSPEEAEQARKMLAAGFTSGPGGCKGQGECEAYCDDMTHMTECVDFAEKAGFMTAEDAARARKMAEMGMTGGPGGCKGEEECRSFCEDPANMNTCIDFAVQIGDMSPEEADQARQRMGQMQEMEGRMKECLVMPCPDALACFQSIQGEQGGSPEEGEAGEGGGAMGSSAEIQTKIESCIQEMQQQGGGEGAGFGPGSEMMPPEGFEGEMPPFNQGEFHEGQIPEGFVPSEGMSQPPSQEEMERIIQEETQRRIQEETQRMMEQFVPPPSTEPPPQSFLNQVKNFLAGLMVR